MKFNYTLDTIMLKASWFECSKSNVFKEIGEKGLNIYIKLFKFRLWKQEHKFLFVTSIEALRDETGYTIKEIVDSFKLLVKNNIICFDGVPRWDRIKAKDMLVCYATDMPVTSGNSDNENEKKPFDKYLYLDFKMINYYEHCGLNEKYFPLYCYITHYCGINTENKAYAPNEDLVMVTGYHKDVITKMIQTMNRMYLMYSEMRKNKSNAYSYHYYEHRICMKYDELKHFQSGWLKDGIDKNIKAWDKKKERKTKKGDFK